MLSVLQKNAMVVALSRGTLATSRLDYSISAHMLSLLAKRSSFEMAQKTISAALSIPPTI